MSARGNRTLGSYDGYVFCHGSPDNNKALSKQCLENKGPSYDEAALLLRVITEFGKIDKSKGGLAKIEKELAKSTWRIKVQ